MTIRPVGMRRIGSPGLRLGGSEIRRLTVARQNIATCGRLRYDYLSSPSSNAVSDPFHLLLVGAEVRTYAELEGALAAEPVDGVLIAAPAKLTVRGRPHNRPGNAVRVGVSRR